MTSEISKEFVDLATQLAILGAKNVAQQAAAKFKLIRTKKDINVVCNDYEEIINNLVRERGELISIANAYQSELNRYEITDTDIKYLQATLNNCIKVLENFAPENQNYSNDESIQSLSSILSVDTLKAMQLLGFDYKKAIGDPLTDVCADFIRAKLGNKNAHSNKASQRRK